MYTRIVTFSLDGPTHDDYVEHANLVAHAFASWRGLLSKIWLADPATNRYGGVYVFATKEDADASRETAEFLSILCLPTYCNVVVEEYEVLDLARSSAA